MQESFPRDWRLGVSAIVTDLRRYGCDYLAFGTRLIAADVCLCMCSGVGACMRANIMPEGGCEQREAIFFLQNHA